MSNEHPEEPKIPTDDRLSIILNDVCRNGSWGLNKSLADHHELTPHEQKKISELGKFVHLLKQVDLREPTIADKQSQHESIKQEDVDTVQAFGNHGLVDRSDSLPISIGHYRILSQLGKGGYGVVYQATDPFLERDVALKVIQPDGRDEQEVTERFEREARAVALLSHPGIVPIFDFGSDGKTLYIAFELCQGRNLEQCLEEGNSIASPDLAARIVKQLAESIQHAHSRGIIHRDLKPNNVLVQQSDFETGASFEQVIDPSSLRISDFGLAKIGGDNDSELTASGFCVGTPSYMSPEQATGEVAVSFKSDIYSLGAIFYRLLTGAPPHQRSTRIATLQALVSEDCESPRRRNPNVSRDLAAICLKCLQRDPERRYESSQALADDLERFLQGHRVSVRETTPLENLVKWRRRNPKLAYATMFAIAATLIGASLTTWQWRESESNLQDSQRNAHQAQENLAKAENAIDRMLNDVAIALENQPAMTELRLRLLSDALDLQNQILESERSNRTTLRTIQSHRRVAEIHRLMGESELAIEAYQTSIQLASKVNEPSQAMLNELVLCELKLSALLLVNEQIQFADQIIERTFERINVHSIDSNEYPIDSRLVAECHYLKARILDIEGKLDESEQQFGIAIDRLSPLTETEPVVLSQLATYYNSLAILQNKLGEEENAYENFIRSIECIESNQNEIHQSKELQAKIASTGINLGNHFSVKRDYDRASQAYTKCIETLDVLTTSFPSVASYHALKMTAQVGLGVAEHRLGNLANAEDVLHSSIKIGEQLDKDQKLTPAGRDTLLRAYGSLATLHQSQGDFAASDQLFIEAIRFVDVLITNHPQNLDHRHTKQLLIGNRALGMMKQGRYSESVEQFETSRKVASETHIKNPNNARFEQAVVWNQRMCAHAYAYSGRTDACLRLLRDLVDTTDDRRLARSQAALQVIATIVNDPMPGSMNKLQLSDIETEQFVDVAIEIVTAACERETSTWDLLPITKLDSAFGQSAKWKQFTRRREQNQEDRP